MGVEPPEMHEIGDVADLWVSLARDQRTHRSHLRAEPNRSSIQESLAQRVVTEGVLVSRAGDTDARPKVDESTGDDDAETTGTDPRRIVGFVMFGPETGSYDLDVSRGVVENLYVDPAYRGEGRGSALLEAAERRLFEAGFDRVTLEVLAANDGARRFYERHGYTTHRLELEKGAENDTHSKGE